MSAPSNEYRPLDNAEFNIRRYFPFLTWIKTYSKATFSEDLIAGLVVAIMLIPQGMAYALLAGLPPQVGLYASILPLIIYGLLGTSRTLAIGPVAMISLLVASAVASLNPQSISDTLLLTITLTFMVGVLQLAMGLLRVGFIVNFLSHPVLSGFTSAAALVIGFSQLKNILGFDIPRTEQLHEVIIYVIQNIEQTHILSLIIALSGMTILLYFKFYASKHLTQIGFNEGLLTPITKMGSLLIVIISTWFVWQFELAEKGVAIVGIVPSGLPPLTIPTFNRSEIEALFPIALTIALIAYMQSISIAKSLASKRRQKIDPNQELVALGMANIGASFTGGFPITGSFGRSIVNFTSGANTGIASLVTALLVLLSILFLTPLFTYLPNAILAAIIVVAVSSLLDFKTMKNTWRYSKQDFISLLMTFIAVLEFGIENGIMAGVLTSLTLYLWRTSRPHVAILGRIGETEEYRNILRHETSRNPKIIAMRVDESLYFPNAQYLEQVILASIADNPEVEHFVLVASAVNFIDSSSLEVLENLVEALNTNDVSFYMAKVKGPVMDRLRRVGFVNRIGEDKFFLTCYHAIQVIENQI